METLNEAQAQRLSEFRVRTMNVSLMVLVEILRPGIEAVPGGSRVWSGLILVC